MVTIKTPSGDIMCVNMHKEVCDIKVSHTGMLPCLHGRFIKPKYGITVDLPGGDWEVLGEIIDEEANFDPEPFLPFDYENKKIDFNATWKDKYPLLTASLNLISLLQAEGMKVDWGKEKVIVLKKMSCGKH